MNRTNTHTEKQYCQKNSLFFFSGTLTGLLGPHRSRSVTDQTLELPPEPNMKEKSSKTNTNARLSPPNVLRCTHTHTRFIITIIYIYICIYVLLC